MLRLGQIIFQCEDEEIAWIQAKSRGLAAIGGNVAVTSRAALVAEIVNRQIHFQYAVLAAQILRFRNRTSLRWARASVIRNFLSKARRIGRSQERGCEQEHEEWVCNGRAEDERARQDISERAKTSHDVR